MFTFGGRSYVLFKLQNASYIIRDINIKKYKMYKNLYSNYSKDIRYSQQHAVA
jgi:hypothetical protein